MDDLCNERGARHLARIIEAYWRSRGYAVKCTLVEQDFHHTMRSVRTDVRSDMVNGMPRRRA